MDFCCDRSMFSSKTTGTETSTKNRSINGSFPGSDQEDSNSKRFSEMDLYQQQSGGGLPLPRYRSAPRSFFTVLLDSPGDKSSSEDEHDAFFSAIWSGTRDVSHKLGEDGCQIMESGPDSELRTGFSNGLTGYDGGGSSMTTGSNLVRQSSSPAGFFNGFGVIGDGGEFGAHRANNSSASDVNSTPLNFSSGPSLSPRIMPINRSIENERSRSEFEPPFSHDSWNGSLKRSHDGDLNMFSTTNELHNNQSAEKGKNSSKLIHHLSLPTTSNEKGEAEKFRLLQFQPDVVPCQIRAKRGCATHPRSIAERMRRTRISEKMKKLQELFPNMDKQTSTADMLDLAVEHIKELQRQVQTLTDAKANCVCGSK